MIIQLVLLHMEDIPKVGNLELFVLSLCKSVQTKGCEKSGRMIEFSSFLRSCGFESVPFIPFRGNRFNIVFYNEGIAYYLHDLCRHFFSDVHSENKLLTAVFYDLQVDSYIIGCRALGLINKFVTGPLWRLLESNTHILDLSFQFQKMETLFSELAVDASRILKDDVVFFPDFPISKDVVFEKLIRPSKVFDEGTKQCLEILFGSFSIITKRMLHDHLQGGKYVCSEELSKVSFGVSKTNSISERDFGMLDRLIREKPNANQITLEAIIMTRTNKMSSWRDSLTEEKRKRIMEWARLSKVEQFQSFKRRRENVRQQQEEKQLDKIEVREKKN